MPAEIGRLTDIGLGKESTRLTAQGSADIWLQWSSASYNDEIEEVQNESAVGVINDTIDSQVAKQMNSGSLESIVGIDTIDPFLQSVLGTVSTATDSPEAGVNTDTYTVSQDNTHPTYTIFGKDGNETVAIPGALFGSFSLSASQNSYVTVSADFTANPSQDATVSPSYTSETNFISRHVTVEFANDEASLDDSGLTTVRSVDLSIEPNVEDEDALGSVEAVDRFNTQFTVSGSMELLYDGTKFRDDMLNATKQAMRLTLKNDQVTIGSSTNPEIQVDLNKVKFTSREVSREPNDIMSESVDFTAHYDLGDAKEIEVTRIYTP